MWDWPRRDWFPLTSHQCWESFSHRQTCGCQTTVPAATGQEAAPEFPGLNKFLQAVYPGSGANSTATHRRATGRHVLVMDASNEPQLQLHQGCNLCSGNTHTSRSRRRLVPGVRCQQHSHGSCTAAAVYLEAPRIFQQEELDSTQLKYLAFDRELSAAFLSMRHFRNLLDGRQFRILTDHRPFTECLTHGKPESSGNSQSWLNSPQM